MILPDGYSDIPAGKIAAIVTHLEMTERLAIRSDPPGANAWTLRKVAHPTTDWFRELYSRIGAEWMWYARLKLPDAELAAKIQSPGVDIHALMQNGRDEGLLELDFRQAGACEIGMFGVTAHLVGTGAGRFLMNRALELAWSRDVQRVWLHTCSFDHPSALSFYQRSGFRPFRRQIVVGDDPRLDGTAPRDVAKHVPVIE
ncbi:MAG: GNAT family N-acetyltransferase [Bradyrhizobium sp.]|uniref:GNAT family N-acetyltransferase n=1 Tax=Bradyrhizobium sp. TaxID=376 RepID=UPI001D295739|nr:GNAT family N-acetyltransferase [Bradyrhizobium sp.]MBV9561848.1 GNAT family N-acetyltransferase [Bradyrhizobium sp.]